MGFSAHKIEMDACGILYRIDLFVQQGYVSNSFKLVINDIHKTYAIIRKNIGKYLLVYIMVKQFKGQTKEGGQNKSVFVLAWKTCEFVATVDTVLVSQMYGETVFF